MKNRTLLYFGPVFKHFISADIKKDFLDIDTILQVGIGDLKHTTPKKGLYILYKSNEKTGKLKRALKNLYSKKAIVDHYFYSLKDPSLRVFVWYIPQIEEKLEHFKKGNFSKMYNREEKKVIEKNEPPLLIKRAVLRGETGFNLFKNYIEHHYGTILDSSHKEIEYDSFEIEPKSEVLNDFKKEALKSFN